MIDRPVPALILLLCVVGFFLSQIPKFKLDASSESLVLENDDDLAYYRQIGEAYESSDFLIITWTPFDDIMSDRSLDGLKNLRNELRQIERVESVVTMLDVPLIDSPRVSFSDLKKISKRLKIPVSIMNWRARNSPPARFTATCWSAWMAKQQRFR